jgi:hypothetical protein
MLDKQTIATAYRVALTQWQRDDDDNRKQEQMTVDFICDSNVAAKRPLIHQIRQTIQVLTTMLGSPSLPKYERSLIKDVIEANQKLINAESEAINA